MGLEQDSTTPASNTRLFPEGMNPSDVNDNLRQYQADVRTWYIEAEWVNLGNTHVFVAATQFKIAGVDVTAEYSVGRRIKLIAATPGTIYGRITTTVFSTDTTVTVVFDSGSLSNETITSVSLALIQGGSSRQSVDVSGVKNAVSLTDNNTFTGNQTFSGSLTASSTVSVTGIATFTANPAIDKAGSAGILTIRSDSTTGVTAQVDLGGHDSTAVNTVYSSLISTITDDTDGSEDANVIIKTMSGGTLSTAVTITGAGNANITTLSISGDVSEQTLQTVVTTFATKVTTTTPIILGDSIPQNDEGVEVTTQAITPKSASSTLSFTIDVPVTAPANAYGSMGLFVDSDADAIASTIPQWGGDVSNAREMNLHLQFSVASASTSARTYKIRAGSNSSSSFVINPDLYGGVAITRMTITEVL